MNSTRSQRKKRNHCSSSVFRLLSALLLFTQWLTNCLFVIFFFSFSFFFLLQILPSTVPLFSRLSLCLCLLSASDPALFFSVAVSRFCSFLLLSLSRSFSPPSISPPFLPSYHHSIFLLPLAFVSSFCVLLTLCLEGLGPPDYPSRLTPTRSVRDSSRRLLLQANANPGSFRLLSLSSSSNHLSSCLFVVLSRILPPRRCSLQAVF